MEYLKLAKKILRIGDEVEMRPIENIDSLIENKLKNIEINYINNFLEFNKNKSINDYNFLPLLKKLGLTQIFSKQEKSRRDMYDGNIIIHSSDSNVFIKDGENGYVLKLYDSLSSVSIKEYHEYQNRFSNMEYTIKTSGKIENKKFKKVKIKVLNLGNQIYGNNQYSFTVLKPIKKSFENKNVIFDDSQNSLDYIIIKTLSKTGFKVPININTMNYSITGLNNGIMEITITDILDKIRDFNF